MRTVVVVSQGVHTDLEEALEERYGLLEAVVVDVEGDEPAILAGIGSAGASYLEATLTGGERIGISTWSQTLLSVVDRMHPLRLAGADNVVQLIGGIGVSSAQARANRLLERSGPAARARTPPSSPPQGWSAAGPPATACCTTSRWKRWPPSGRR